MTYTPEEKETLITEIKEHIEWLSTTDGDEIECISIENLEGIMDRFLKQTIKLSEL